VYHKAGLVAYEKEKRLVPTENEPQFHGRTVRGPVTNNDTRTLPQLHIKNE